MNRVVRKIILAFVIPVIILFVWFFMTTYGNIPTGVLPTIPAVGKAFVDMVKSGQLQEDLLVSLGRVLKGFLVSGILGIVLGSIIGMFEPA